MYYIFVFICPYVHQRCRHTKDHRFAQGPLLNPTTQAILVRVRIGYTLRTGTYDLGKQSLSNGCGEIRYPTVDDCEILHQLVHGLSPLLSIYLYTVFHKYVHTQPNMVDLQMAISKKGTL